MQLLSKDFTFCVTYQPLFILCTRKVFLFALWAWIYFVLFFWVLDGKCHRILNEFLDFKILVRNQTSHAPLARSDISKQIWDFHVELQFNNATLFSAVCRKCICVCKWISRLQYFKFVFSFCAKLLICGLLLYCRNSCCQWLYRWCTVSL